MTDDVNRQIKKYEDTPGYKNIFKSEDELRKQYGPGFDKAMEEYANRDWRSGTSIRDITKKYGVEDATYEIEKLSNYKHMLNTRSNVLKEMPTKTSGSHTVVSSPSTSKGPNLTKRGNINPVEFKKGVESNLEDIISRHGRDSDEYTKAFNEYADMHAEGVFTKDIKPGSPLYDYLVK